MRSKYKTRVHCKQVTTKPICSQTQQSVKNANRYKTTQFNSRFKTKNRPDGTIHGLVEKPTLTPSFKMSSLFSELQIWGHFRQNCGFQGRRFKVICGKSVPRQIAVLVINFDEGAITRVVFSITSRVPVKPNKAAGEVRATKQKTRMSCLGFERRRAV